MWFCEGDGTRRASCASLRRQVHADTVALLVSGKSLRLLAQSEHPERWCVPVCVSSVSSDDATVPANRKFHWGSE